MADAPLPEGLCEAWETFFQSEHTREVGESVYHEIFDHPMLFPLQRRVEMMLMMKVARRIGPTVIVEIGADKAGSFYHWIKCNPFVKKAIAIEIRGTPYDDLFRKAFPNIEFLFVPAGSREIETISKVREFLGEDKIDCLFLDGDKGAFGLDFAMYGGFVHKGSLVMLHDIHGTALPVNVFVELEGHYHTTKLVDTSEGRAAKEREAAGEPVTTSHEGWLRIWGETSCGVGVVHI